MNFSLNIMKRAIYILLCIIFVINKEKIKMKNEAWKIKGRSTNSLNRAAILFNKIN